MRTDVLLEIQHRDQFTDALFRMVFGRKPNHKLDRTFLVRYLNTIGKTREELLELHLKSGITKEQLAAIYETGITPTRDDFKRYPSRLLQRWVDIASEPPSANAVNQRLTPKILTDSVGEAATAFYLEFSNSVIRICHLLETGAKGVRYSDVGTLFLYILARSAELLRGIRVLINNDESATILGLVRGLYECFTRLLFANRKPELAWALILPAMVDGKKFEYCKNRVGRVERRRCAN